MFQVVGGQIYKLLLETAASQVRMPDGVSVETRVNTLERALSANTQMHFADTIEARDKLRGLIPGDKVHVADASADETVEKAGRNTFTARTSHSARLRKARAST